MAQFCDPDADTSVWLPSFYEAVFTGHSTEHPPTPLSFQNLVFYKVLKASPHARLREALQNTRFPKDRLGAWPQKPCKAQGFRKPGLGPRVQNLAKHKVSGRQAWGQASETLQSTRFSRGEVGAWPTKPCKTQGFRKAGLEPGLQNLAKHNVSKRQAWGLASTTLQNTRFLKGSCKTY